MAIIPKFVNDQFIVITSNNISAFHGICTVILCTYSNERYEDHALVDDSSLSYCNNNSETYKSKNNNSKCNLSVAPSLPSLHPPLCQSDSHRDNT